MGTLLAAAVGTVSLAWFTSLERRGRPHVVLAVILGLLLFEAALLPSSGNVAPGLFRMQALGQDIRLPQLLIPLALLARLFVRGLPTRASVEGIVWAAFLTWYTTAFAIGVLGGNPFEIALFEAESVLFVGGGAALSAGVPLGKVIDARTMGRWIVVLGVGVAVLGPLTLLDATREVSIPGIVTIPDFGALVADGRSLLVVVGAVGLLVELCRPRVRMGVAVAGLLLVATPLFGHQRAAIIGMVVVVAGIAALSVGPTWSARAKVTGTQAGLVMAALVGAVALVVAVSADADQPTVLAENFEATFYAQEQSESAEARRGLWQRSLELVGERPVLGWGMGKQITLDDKTMTSHNLVFDLLIRSGTVGLGLFLAAFALTGSAALAVWRRHDDPRVAALAVACVIGMLSLVGKGMVESMLESFRLATMFGLLIGGVLAARTSLQRDGRHVGRDTRRLAPHQ